MRFCHCLIAASSLALVTASAPAAIAVDTFETYSSDAELQAAWPGNAAATLSTTLGNPGQSAFHPGGAVNSQTFTPVSPTDAVPLVLTADIYDDGTDLVAGDGDAEKRMTVGLRNTATVENLVEMGMYDAGVQYVYRVVLFASGAGDGSGGQGTYGKFDLGTDENGDRNRPTQGWHRFIASIGDTQSTFMMDLMADGTIDATHVVDAVPTASGMNNVRFGGISGLSSAGGGANFDNISLASIPIPEPAALGVLALGGLLMSRRRMV